MRIKNVSARLHHIGNLSLAPGQEGECPKGFEKSFNTNDIQEVKPAKAPTAAELKAKAAAVQAAESKLASAKLGGDADAIAAAEAELAELAA